MGLFNRQPRIEKLLKILENEAYEYSSGDQARAAEALGKSGNRDAVRPLISCLKHGAAEVRIAVVNALGVLGDEEAIVPLEKALDAEVYSRDAARAMVASLVRLTGRPESDFSKLIIAEVPPLHPLVEGAYVVACDRVSRKMVHSWLTSVGSPRELRGQDLIRALLVPIQYCFHGDDLDEYRGHEPDLDLLSEAVATLHSYTSSGHVQDDDVARVGPAVEEVYKEAKSSSDNSPRYYAALSVAQGMAALGNLLGFYGSWASAGDESLQRLCFNAGRDAAYCVSVAAAREEAQEAQRVEIHENLLADLVAVSHAS